MLQLQEDVHVLIIYNYTCNSKPELTAPPSHDILRTFPTFEVQAIFVFVISLMMDSLKVVLVYGHLNRWNETKICISFRNRLNVLILLFFFLCNNSKNKLVFTQSTISNYKYSFYSVKIEIHVQVFHNF